MISIYLPTRNRRRLLERAVESVLGQDYEDFELIIVDDGSTDDTPDYLVNVASRDGRIKTLSNVESFGACASRNKAISLAIGEYITGLDDDDYFEPNHLSTLVKEYNNKVSRDAYIAVYPQIKTLTRSGFVQAKHQRSSAERSDLLVSNGVGNQVFLLTRVMRDAGCFDQEMPAWQDYELWIRLTNTVKKMYRAGEPTYVQDESHEDERITHKPPEIIYCAYEQMLKKHFTGLSRRKQLRLRMNYHSYPQARFSFAELLEYFTHGLFLKPTYHYIRVFGRDYAGWS